MPFKSKAQRNLFREKVLKGEITQEEFNEWDSETPTSLPERVEKKSGRKRTKVGVVRKSRVIK